MANPFLQQSLTDITAKGQFSTGDTAQGAIAVGLGDDIENA